MRKCVNLKKDESNFEKFKNNSERTNLINNIEDTSDQGIVPSDNFDDKVITNDRTNKSTRKNKYLIKNKKEALHVDSNNKNTVQKEKHFCSICNIQVCSNFEAHLK